MKKTFISTEIQNKCIKRVEMDRKGLKVLGIFALLVIAIFSINFVLATSAPTGLTILRNVTVNYDEGNFTVNWTSGGGVVKNYSIYTYLAGGGGVFTRAYNNSPVGYSFNNWTEGNYTFIVGALNTTGAGNEANATANVSIYVDRTAPVISLPTYTNGTAKMNTSQLTLNISVSDASSGLTASQCTVNVNGTNQTFAVSGGWCNFTEGNLSGLTDGYHLISIYANDTVNILGLNNTVYVLTDLTIPTASASCSPASIEVGDAFPCSCSGTDGGSGINSSLIENTTSSPDGTVTPVSSGTFTYTCKVTDNAGNNATAVTVTYSVEEDSVKTSSNTGSTPTTSTPSDGTILPSYTFTQISPGTPVTKVYSDSNLGIKEVQIEVNNPAQSVKITVTKYDDQPAAVTVEKTGKVYKYMQIKVDNIAGKLEKAIITSKVTKSWATSNGLDKDNLALFKFDESAGQWNELTTTYDSEDSVYYYYTSEVTSFSYFALGEKSLVSDEVTGNETTTSGGEETAETSVPRTWIWIAAGVVVLVAVAAVLIMRKKK